MREGLLLMDGDGEKGLFERLADEMGPGEVLVGLTTIKVEEVEVEPVSKEEAVRVGNNWYTESGVDFYKKMGVALICAYEDDRAAVKAAFPEMWEKYDYEPDENGRPMAEGEE